MPKKILIIGGDSIIGKSLSKFFSKNKIKHYKTSRIKNRKNYIHFDLNNFNKNKFKNKLSSFDLIIYCISITNIEECNINPFYSYYINVKQTLSFFSIVKDNQTILYLSTASVFDGNKKRSNIRSKYFPLNQYGIQKAIVEKSILNRKNFIIIRLSKVVSKDMQILKSWRENIKKNIKINAYTNRYINPVSIDYFNKAIKHIIFDLKGRKKIFHISNEKIISRFEFARIWFEKYRFNYNLLKPMKAKKNYKQSNLIINTKLKFVNKRNINYKLFN